MKTNQISRLMIAMQVLMVAILLSAGTVGAVPKTKTLLFVPANITGTIGETMELSASLKDVLGNPVGGANLIFEVNTGHGYVFVAEGETEDNGTATSEFSAFYDTERINGTQIRARWRVRFEGNAQYRKSFRAGYLTMKIDEASETSDDSESPVVVDSPLAVLDASRSSVSTATGALSIPSTLGKTEPVKQVNVAVGKAQQGVQTVKVTAGAVTQTVTEAKALLNGVGGLFRKNKGAKGNSESTVQSAGLDFATDPIGSYMQSLDHSIGEDVDRLNQTAVLDDCKQAARELRRKLQKADLPFGKSLVIDHVPVTITGGSSGDPLDLVVTMSSTSGEALVQFGEIDEASLLNPGVLNGLELHLGPDAAEAVRSSASKAPGGRLTARVELALHKWSESVESEDLACDFVQAAGRLTLVVTKVSVINNQQELCSLTPN